MKLTFLFFIILMHIVNGARSSNEEIRGSKNLLKNLNNPPRGRGKPLPLPQTYISTETQHYLDARNFIFEFIKGSSVCDVVNLAFYRYHKIIFRPDDIRPEAFSVRKIKQNKVKSLKTDPSLLKRLLVNIQSPCEDYPSLESDESYSLEIAADFASIDSKSNWGALRALETFSQLVVEDSDGQFYVNDTFIYDYPRFNHRGILLDTSRHYIDTSILKSHLEAMEANKMNVFHWHIVDDQSFPYVSYTYPELSEFGAYDPYNHIYTNADVKDIIEFGRQRGIRVVPEFDSPGHTQSWGKAVPILTPCYSGSKANGEFGPIDPSNNQSYVFLEKFIKELVSVFPDKYLHLGGDEVDFSCWKSNPVISAFMKKMGFGDDYSKLEQYYMQNLLDIVNEIDPETGYIIWQEVIDNNVKVKPDTVVEVWKDPWPQEMATVTSLGYRALLSTCWYLNYISYGSDWVNYYKCDPLNFNGTDQQKKLVIGGEACMWGEYVDGTNVISRTWPRASAVAERLWSAQNVTDLDEAAERMEEHRCRMIRRGIKAEPFNGSGFCDYEVTS